MNSYLLVNGILAVFDLLVGAVLTLQFYLTCKIDDENKTLFLFMVLRIYEEKGELLGIRSSVKRLKISHR